MDQTRAQNKKSKVSRGSGAKASSKSSKYSDDEEYGSDFDDLDEKDYK